MDGRDHDPRHRTPTGATPAIRGADISFTLQVEAAGYGYRTRNDGRDTGGTDATAIEDVLTAAGLNYVRQRVWVDPPAGYSDRESALTLARRTHAAGMKLLLDPHYADFWADPGKQPTPHAWRDLDVAALIDTVGEYTGSLVRAFADQGTPLDMIQIGNEITNGMLWPLGKLDYAEPTTWDVLARILRAGISATTKASAGATPPIMIHFDRGGDNAGCRQFVSELLARDVQIDVLGLSYYPCWHGSLADLEHNMHDIAATFGIDIVVVETAYPWTLEDGDAQRNFFSETDQLLAGYPATPQGQALFYTDLANLITNVPHGHGLGLMAWEPGWLPVVGYKPGAGNPNDNLTLFDWHGFALPALSCLGGTADTPT